MKPLAFRIRDFRSIKDSGIFSASGDSITVLAGQNEAGKTAVLLALRDFDLSPGELPETPEFRPEGDLEAEPRVAVQFCLEEGDLSSLRESIEFSEFFDRFSEMDTFWIERRLLTGTYVLDEKIWAAAEASRNTDISVPSDTTEAIDNPADRGEDQDPAEVDADTEIGEGPKTPIPPSKEDLATKMHLLWPAFVYFDAFQDTLPRQIEVDSLLPGSGASSTVPQSVRDFIALANIEPTKLQELAPHDKMLGNYLDQRGTSVTGDFLTYWQQKVDGDQNVHLRVEHLRDESGKLKLAFYVRDHVDQYPEQRSKGFLWFLSFYLRLTGERKTSSDGNRLLLIDEPGSYLHARAQRDILHLFESRIVPREQIIYSSHSPFLMPSHTLHRVRLVMKTHQDGTRVYDRLTHPELRGQDFADALTTLIQAIGIDLSQAFTFHRPKNLFVEGITDHIYLTNWAQLFRPVFNTEANILPGFGAPSLLTLASLFIGWRQQFAVLLDRDVEGTKMRHRLTRDFLIPEDRIVQPRDALSIEDFFSVEDFRALLATLDPTLTLNSNEDPSAAVKRQNIDKVLLARTYAERVGRGETTLTKRTQDRIERLLDDLAQAV